jgi:hypothetical protein
MKSARRQYPVSVRAQVADVLGQIVVMQTALVFHKTVLGLSLVNYFSNAENRNILTKRCVHYVCSFTEKFASNSFKVLTISLSRLFSITFFYKRKSYVL